MTHRYKIEPSFGLLIEKFEGKMGWNDVWEGMLRSTKDPEFRPGMNVVADLTTADLDLRIEKARELAIATSTAPSMKYGRVAVVAPGTLQFGLARMFGILSENSDIFAEYNVFSDFSKARTWLGLRQDVELRL